MKIEFTPTILYAILKPFVLIIIASIFYFYSYHIAIIVAQYFHVNILTYLKIVIFIIVLIYFYALLKIFLQKYILTDEQLISNIGVFSIETDYLELYRVKDIQIKKPFFLRLIGVYNLIIHTSDKTHPILYINGINNTLILKNIRTLIETLRKTKRVYEVD